ncbi:apotyrosinase chaperone MelC1 [Kitasatospora sp. LaBMicrA B282]|uniref:apotyrosinase chaperone MelC1 n=1 Tax=Kitasatospora sp. LaBMicrA B282 TaxID=3420949 RepID=UPI003D0E8D86
MSDSTPTTTDLTRRRMLQGAAVAVTAAAGAAVLSLTGPGARPAAAADPGAEDTFDEVFRGRRIQGMPMAGGGRHGAGYMVLIDGRELHLMRNADGTWISVINHYQTFRTPRAIARAAVNALYGAQLTPLAAA